MSQGYVTMARPRTAAETTQEPSVLGASEYLLLAEVQPEMPVPGVCFFQQAVFPAPGLDPLAGVEAAESTTQNGERKHGLAPKMRWAGVGTKMLFLDWGMPIGPEAGAWSTLGKCDGWERAGLYIDSTEVGFERWDPRLVKK